jgi:hypothetical protein
LITVLNNLPGPVRKGLRALRRTLGFSPMQKVLRELRRRGVVLSQLRVLEVFGEDGSKHVQDYARLVRSVEIWEIDPQMEQPLKRNVPGATVRIVDSYEQMKKTDSRFDLIAIDNFPEAISFGRWEHFDLFPDIFRICSNSAILVSNVMPKYDDEHRRYFGEVFNRDDVPAHIAARRAFYRTENGENIDRDQMMGVYRAMAEASGFEVEWHFFQPRRYIDYLVFKVRRRAPAA